MPSLYLQSSEYDLYGATGANDNLVTQASALIDAYVQRPEGMLFTTDSNGNPCFMTNMQPTLTITATQAIVPGENVVVPIIGGYYNTAFMSGVSVVLDRSNPTLTEACVIVAASPGSVTLNKVVNNHAANCNMDFGMAIQEDRAMPLGRPVVVVSRYPVTRLMSGQGQYGYNRRGNMDYSALNHFNLLAAVTQFGGPPTWEAFDVTKAGLDMSTGQIWVPAGILLAYYTNVRVQYISGWTYAALPAQIKTAVGNIVTSMMNFPQLTGNFKMQKAGDSQMERFADTVLDTDTKRLLDPFKVRSFL